MACPRPEPAPCQHVMQEGYYGFTCTKCGYFEPHDFYDPDDWGDEEDELDDEDEGILDYCIRCGAALFGGDNDDYCDDCIGPDET